MSNTKMQKYFEGFSLFTGIVRRNYLMYLVGTHDDLVEKDIPHTRIYEFNKGRIGGIDLKWSACSVSICYFPAERLVAISSEGHVFVMGGGQYGDEQEIVKDKVLQKKVRFREVRGIAGGRAYATGPARKIYRRDAPDIWTCIDAPMPEIDKLMDAGFESIDGFSEENIYAAGWGGEIWHYNGEKWHQIPSPTNLAIYKIRCAGDGYVYACGQLGMLLRGKGNEWAIIEHESTKEDLWGMEWFNGKLYVSTLHFIYVLEGDTLKLVDFEEEDPPSTCYHLSASDGIMWSIGSKNVIEFDGQKWTKILEL